MKGLRFRVAVLGHFARRLAPPVAILAVYVFIAALIVRWDMIRVGEHTPALGDELYAVFMQLMFQPYDRLPSAPIARALFWVTPIVGVVMLAEGLAKVGSSLFDATERRALFTRIRIDSMKDHVVVCGLGHVGYRVVESLRALGQPVVAIERSKDSFAELIRGEDVTVLMGDARRDEILVEAGITRARAVVCATNDDLANLEVALDSKRMNPAIRVVMRMFDQRLATKVGGALDLDQTFSTSALAAPLVALQATEDDIRSVYELAGQLRVIANLTAGSRSAGRSVADFEDLIDGRVVSVQKLGGANHCRPRGFDQIAEGDVLVVDVSADKLRGARSKV
ncbi:MAG: NAD-binding protein [Polyangiaceae bacterium]